MQALIIIAHGSKRESANDEIKNLCSTLKTKLEPKPFATIQYCFLELTEPDLLSCIASVVQSFPALKTIRVLPYFLSSGKHVDHDIPKLIEKLHAHYPAVDFVCDDYIGKNQALIPLLMAKLG